MPKPDPIYEMITKPEWYHVTHSHRVCFQCRTIGHCAKHGSRGVGRARVPKKNQVKSWKRLEQKVNNGFYVGYHSDDAGMYPVKFMYYDVPRTNRCEKKYKYPYASAYGRQLQRLKLEADKAPYQFEILSNKADRLADPVV